MKPSNSFIEVLFQFQQMHELTPDQIAQIYFYAEKHQIWDFKAKILHQRWSKTANVDMLTKCLDVSTKHQLDELCSKLENIRLEITGQRALDFYEICLKYKKDKLMDQVVNFLKAKDIDRPWSLDLIMRIATKNRKDFKHANAKLSGFKNKTYSIYCLHGSQYIQMSGCSGCKHLFDNWEID